MNGQTITSLARKLASRDNLWSAEDEAELHVDLLRYANGELVGEDADVLAELIAADPRVAEQFTRCKEAVRFINTEEGKQWVATATSKALSFVHEGRDNESPATLSKCLATAIPSLADATDVAERPKKQSPGTNIYRVSFLPLSFALAAQTANAGPNARAFTVVGSALTLLLQPQLDGKHISFLIFKDNGQPAFDLDGSMVVVGGKGHPIRESRTVVPGDVACLEFAFTTADGRDVELKEQS